MMPLKHLSRRLISGSRFLTKITFLLLLCAAKASAIAAVPGYHNFSGAALIDASGGSETEKAAITMLREEVNVRTGIDLQRGDTKNPAKIIAGTSASLRRYPEYAALLGESRGSRPDGYVIKLVTTGSSSPLLLIAGDDARGMLFGIGHFLRKANLSKNGIWVPGSISADTAPVVAIRGHQLGYRPKVNSYDGFTVSMWEQYIRDLAVFGTNAVELMPPNTDDDAHSPMFTLPQKEMLIEMSSLLKKYGLDVWMWYPLMYGNYSKEEVARKSLAENDSIFKSMPRLDAVFIPGGDPGRQEPETFFKHLERKAKVLHTYHPKAELWMSPQGYSAEWMTRFIEIMKKKPAVLTGIVHGPWTRMDVDSLRKIIPGQYPIRRYPDITHSIDAQYFVPDWDFAYTVTENRETINPRPVDQKLIFRAAKPENYKGFITYSEGVNDDVNKIIWSALGWNPDAEVTEILRDYGRYFIGAGHADDFAQALLGLEKNWRGALISNQGVYTHHAIFQEIERNAPPRVKLNWRFQMALYRSYYDAYTRSRLIYESHLEDLALGTLRRARELGAGEAMKTARQILARASSERVSQDWRQRIFELAEALFQSIRMQLSVDKYHAIATIRGANLDLVDSPLNNRFWLEDQFARIEKIEGEEARIREILSLTDWENPGPGGFYDDLGNPENQSHVVASHNYAKDPNSFHSPFAGLPGGYSLEMERIVKWRTSWKTYMQTIYGLPLEMRYENLDPDARYQVKVTYIEDEKIRLTAGNGLLVHDYLLPAVNPAPVVFDVPAEAVRNGSLSLRWNIDPNGMGPGRGCSVAEVWLIRKKQK